MSFRAMAWATSQKTGSGTRKLILLMLADRASDSNKCYPSHKKLAEDCELSRDTIIRAIKQLESDDFLEIIHRSKDGTKLSNIYKLNVRGVVAEKYKGSSTILHKPIIEPITVSNEDIKAFENLWSDFSVLASRKKFQVGNKSKAYTKYLDLVKKGFTHDAIYGVVELEAEKEYAFRHLITIFNQEF